MQADPVSGPEIVVHVVDGAEVVLHTVVVQTCWPRELQTQVLQSTVEIVPGVQTPVDPVVVVVVVVVVEVVLVVVVVVVVVVDAPQSRVVQTGCPSDPHTQVLQSWENVVPGVQLFCWSPKQELGQ